MAMRPELERLLTPLLARPQSIIELDTLSVTLGNLDVTFEEIDAFMTVLEQHGKVIGPPHDTPASTALAPTIQTARELRLTLGRTPSVREIAQAASLDESDVRRALLFVQVLQR